MMNLKIARIRKGLTQDELAKAVGIARNTVSRYETGDTKPSFDMVVKLAKILNINLIELIDDYKIKEEN